jgi:hypothetical protein
MTEEQTKSEVKEIKQVEKTLEEAVCQVAATLGLPLYLLVKIDLNTKFRILAASSTMEDMCWLQDEVKGNKISYSG